MRKKVLAAGFLMVVLFAVGCAKQPTLYDRMAAAVKPKGDELQQTQLAHIGHVDTADGRYEVAVQWLVCTGMLAPRGQRRLLLFTEKGTLAASFSYHDGDFDPLWCEGGKLYLAGFGRINEIPAAPQLAAKFSKDEDEGWPTGNAIDFSRGIKKAVFIREPRYGSSGGFEDATERLTE